MDTSLDLPTLRIEFEQILRDRAEFNASAQECQQQIQQAHVQIQNLTVRLEQLRGALAYMELPEKRIRAEIEVRVAALAALPAAAPAVIAPPVSL